MAICKGCIETAKKNRDIVDLDPHLAGDEDHLYEYPSDCGCPCQKAKTRQWEDMFLVGRPYNEEAS